ncbi:MAG TPA: CBS domain-containing protein [bacterium]|nr:CBS domain-containing protein [bacterium]
MTRDVKFCLPEDTAYHAARMMEVDQVGVLPVVDNLESQKLTGILTDRDLAMRVMALGGDPKKVRVQDIMSGTPISCRVEDEVSRACHAMAEFNIRRVPVVDSTSRLMGILSRSDVEAEALAH